MFVANFYMDRAQQNFENCFKDDPNVVSTSFCGQKLRVSLWNLDEGYFPTVIDGIPVEYVQATPLEEAS